MQCVRTTVLAIAVVSASAAIPRTALSEEGDETSTRNTVKVFLLAGQSNMDGRGDGSRLSDDDKARLERAQRHIRFAYNRNPVVPLNVTVPSPFIARKFQLERTFGPELFFGLSLSDAWPDEEILTLQL